MTAGLGPLLALWSHLAGLDPHDATVLAARVEDLQGRWDSGGRRGHGGPAGGYGGHWPQRCFDHWQVRAPPLSTTRSTTAFSLCTTTVL